MKTIAVIAAALVLSACASIMHGTNQDIGISSSPTGAQVTVNNVSYGSTPVVAKLSRKRSHIVRLGLEGYEPADLTLTKTVSGWVWGNVVFGGLIGLGVDAMSGGLYNLTPNQLQSTLAAQRSSIAPTKDGIYVVLVERAEPSWQKIGQLYPLSTVVGE